MIAYRDIGPDDAAALADLHRRSFIETFGHLYRPEDLEAFLAQLDEACFREELLDGRHQVRFAEADGVPVAFVKLGPVTLPVEPARPALEFRQLYVLKPWHGRGVATELMRWVLGEARGEGAEELYLSVFIDNHRARRFYGRHGFEVVGTYHFMVGAHADDELIMRLSLEDARDR